MTAARPADTGHRLTPRCPDCGGRVRPDCDPLGRDLDRCTDCGRPWPVAAFQAAWRERHGIAERAPARTPPCVICRQPVPPPSANRRPRKYCGNACARAGKKVVPSAGVRPLFTRAERERGVQSKLTRYWTARAAAQDAERDARLAALRGQRRAA